MKIQRGQSFWGFYRRYTKSTAWLRRRSSALQRDGDRCRGCDTTENLHCAHRTYEHVGDERPGELLTLCDRCHAWFDDERTVWTKAQKDAYLWAHPYLTLPQRGVENDRALLRASVARLTANVTKVARETVLVVS